MDEIARLAPEDAFRLAIHKSGYAVAVLAERLNWSESFLYRVISSEKYFPSFEDIPAFCKAVGNTIVIDWLAARVGYEKGPSPEVTPDYLRDQVVGLASECGTVASKVKDAVADEILTKAELRGILKTVLELTAFIETLAGELRDAEKKVGRHA